MNGKKEDILLSHAYDGIEEYDNSLPRWWIWLFYATGVFSLVYIGYYHFGPGLSQVAVLEREQKEAAAISAASVKKSVGDDEFQAILKDPARIAAGKVEFQTHCIACHGMSGEGIVGPNLTDTFWLHGNTPQEIRNTIREGVPAKGMISWKAIVEEKEIQSLVAYILSIQGSNPANPKKPEGVELPAATSK